MLDNECNFNRHQTPATISGTTRSLMPQVINPDVSAETIIESVADRSAIEQNFHQLAEVHGAGEQQVRNVCCNVARWNLCLWLHTIVE